ncbi:MAG: hypothetical protein LBT70_00570 [Holosporaceae bacterium]|jgi:hypothetical protein|nr:hypothetical protein [Holosporaceae bacterium]
MKNILTCSIVVLGMMCSAPINATDNEKNKLELSDSKLKQINKLVSYTDITADANDLNSEERLDDLNVRHKSYMIDNLKNFDLERIVEVFADNFLAFYKLRHYSAPKQEIDYIREFLRQYTLGHCFNINAIQYALNHENFPQGAKRSAASDYQIADLAVPDSNVLPTDPNILEKIAIHNNLVVGLSDYILADKDYQDILKSELVSFGDKKGLADAASLLEYTNRKNNKQQYTAFRKFLNNLDFFNIVNDPTATRVLKDGLKSLEDTITFSPTAFKIYLNVPTVRMSAPLIGLSPNIWLNFVLAYYQYKYEEFAATTNIKGFIEKLEGKEYFPYNRSLLKGLSLSNIKEYHLDGVNTVDIPSVFEHLNSMHSFSTSYSAGDVFVRAMKIALGLPRDTAWNDVCSNGNVLYASQKQLSLAKERHSLLQNELSNYISNEGKRQPQKIQKLISAIELQTQEIQKLTDTLEKSNYLHFMGVTENLNNTSEHTELEKKHHGPIFSTLLEKAHNEIAKISSDYDGKLIKYMLNALNLLMDKYEEKNTTSKEILSQITSISGILFQAFNHCTAAQVSGISNIVNSLLAQKDLTPVNLDYRNIIKIALYMITHDVFDKLFIHVSANTGIDDEDTMAKGHIRSVLKGKYSISIYNGQNVKRSSTELFTYLSQLNGKNKDKISISQKAFEGLPLNLRTLKAFQDNSTFDYKIIPELMNNALSASYVIEELLNNTSYSVPIITSFVNSLNTSPPLWTSLDDDKRRLIIFHALINCGYLKKK